MVLSQQERSSMKLKCFNESFSTWRWFKLALFSSLVVPAYFAVNLTSAVLVAGGGFYAILHSVSVLGIKDYAHTVIIGCQHPLGAEYSCPPAPWPTEKPQKSKHQPKTLASREGSFFIRFYLLLQ
jgi:hypothetical protein